MILPVALDAHDDIAKKLIPFENRYFGVSEMLVIGGFILTVLFCLSLVYALWFNEKKVFLKDYQRELKCVFSI